MSSPSYKSIALANDLAMTLNQRLSGTLTFAVSAGSDGSPILSAGSGTAGTENVVIRLRNYLVAQNAAAVTASAPSPYLDELGLNAAAYSPTVAEVVLEAAGQSTMGGGVAASGTLTLSTASGSVGGVINGTTVTVTASGGDTATATAIAAAINANAHTSKWVVASSSAAVVTVTALPGLGTLGNQIAFTASGTGVTASGSGFLASGTVVMAASNAALIPSGDLLKAIGEVIGRGSIVQMYLTAAGTAPSAGAGTLAGQFATSALYPAMSTN